jgi:hypothetical protein
VVTSAEGVGEPPGWLAHLFLDDRLGSKDFGACLLRANGAEVRMGHRMRADRVAEPGNHADVFPRQVGHARQGTVPVEDVIGADGPCWDEESGRQPHLGQHAGSMEVVVVAVVKGDGHSPPRHGQSGAHDAANFFQANYVEAAAEHPADALKASGANRERVLGDDVGDPVE